MVDGVVHSSHARWSGDRIVTESVVRRGDGSEVAVVQMGGTVNGIGMVQFPGQPLLAPGDRVSLRIQIPRGDAKSRARWRTRWVDEVVTIDRSGRLGSAATSKQAGADPRTGADPSDRIDVPDRPYVRTMNDHGAALYWSSGCIYITYDAAGTSHLDGDLEFQIMDAVFATWRSGTQDCSYLTFEIESPVDIEVGFDGINVVKFRDVNWCRPATETEPEQCYSSSAAGLTTLHFVNDGDSSRNGEILDGDVEFNGVDYAISNEGNSNGTPNCLSDLANTATHEIGHLMGLEHSCLAPTDSGRVDHQGNPVPSCSEPNLPAIITESTMYNYQACGETDKATLSDDDINAICGIYPLADDPNECEPASIKQKRGCAVAPGSDSSGVAIWMLLALALLWRRRRHTA